MDSWVERAMAKWPNVPFLFGWLGLSRRGDWLIQGERISHPRIVDTIARNYGVDDHGRWFFQNGPQRGYIALAFTPLIVRVQDDDSLRAHTGQPIETAETLYLDDNGAAILDTDQGALGFDGAALSWVLERLRHGDAAVDDSTLADALARPGGETTDLTLAAFGRALPVRRVATDAIAATLGFERDPAPREDDPGRAPS